jgi:hypothetical protein
MHRPSRLFLLIPLFFVLEGCGGNGTDGLPSVPRPPPEGTVKTAPAGSGVLPKAAAKRLAPGKARLPSGTTAG